MQAPKNYSRAPITEALIEIQVKLPPLETVENISEIDYKPVPPKHSEQVIVRAQFKGRKKPLPYIFDEE